MIKKLHRAWAYLSAETMSQLNMRAKEEGISRSELILKAVIMYLTKDVTDESLLIAKMSEIIRQLQFIDKKIDVSQKLDLEYYQYFFLNTPDFPGNDKEKALEYKKAGEKTEIMLGNFKKRFKHLPTLLETVLGDMLEEDVSKVKKNG